MALLLCILIAVSLMAVVLLIALGISGNKEGFESLPAPTNNKPRRKFLFHDNQCSPDCCVSGKGNTYSCSVGCVCVDNDQQNLLTSRGGNHTTHDG